MKAMAMATTARAITKTTRKVVFSLLSSSSDRLVIVRDFGKDFGVESGFGDR